ncbi:AAA family ATPase [Priestia megaterium]|uniref:AAA family ATPase n=1 Tax=Priestia megaterium TaxID=1404 RepID=UPI0013228EBE|nr:ATP-binding protein [Priestia megaterium]MUL33936.1 DNA replication and repair protein RecF [Priestia megaterium]
MKITHLYIEKYRNLRDFNLSMDKSKGYIQILIGRNGSGKSNVLEAITLIFKGMSQQLKPEFSFELTYTLKGENIIVRGIKDDSFLIHYRGVEMELNKMMATLQYRGETILPDNIVLFYSGVNGRLEDLISDIEDNFKKTLGQGSFIPRRFFYIKQEHYSMFILSLLCSEHSEIQRELNERFGIERIDSFKISFTENSSKATGEVKAFLNLLEKKATHINMKQKEKELIFENAFPLLNEIREEVGFARDVLKLLDIAYYSGYVNLPSITLWKTSKEKIPHEHLSEGEQQLLLLTGLVEFFGYKETLYLLDEPDMPLHPKWQRDLKEYIEIFDVKQQFIITTHSANILTTVTKENVYILVDGSTLDNTPFTLGRDINSILMELMGVTLRYDKTDDKLDEFYELIDDMEFDKAQTLLDLLKTQMGEDDTEMIRAQSWLDMEKDS